MAQDKEQKKRVTSKPLGASGTDIFSGIITEEYNTTLSDVQGIKIYDEMRRSDGTVRAAVSATQLPIRRANWFIQPASEDEKDIEISNFVSRALFDEMDLTWDDFLRQALLMLPFGVMLFEKVFEVRDIDGKSSIIWKNLAPRMPKSITAWEMADGEPGVQQLTTSGHSASIPAEKLLVFVNELEGENWWGISLLRAAYKHWYIKTNLERIDSAAHERQGLGIPFVTLPENHTSDDVSKAKNILKNLRANDRGYLLEYDELAVEFKDMKANTTREPHKSIAYHNREIVLSVLAQFLDLGSGPSGSRALSEDQSSLFLLSLEAVANNVKDIINKFAIKELVDLNFDNVEAYPELDFSGIARVDADKLSTAYQRFTQSGGLKPIMSDEQYIRGIMGLPEKTEDDEEVEPDELDMNEPHLKKKIFQEDEEFKPWRKLTFAEEKVNFQSIQNQMNKLEGKLTKESREVLTKAKDEYLKKLTRAIEKGDTALINSLGLKFNKEYAVLMNKVLKDAYSFAKNNAAKEMGVAAPPNNANAIRSINISSDAIAKKQADQIVAEAKIVLADRIAKGESVSKTVGAIDAAMAKTIDKITRDTAAIVIPGNINLGRRTVFDKNDDKIYALQRSEILDARTCNFCLSMDERIIEKDDPLGKIGTYHSSCRGIWVEILLAEENKPKISGVPKSIRSRLGDTTNELVQPKKPIVKKDSSAAKKINKGKAGQ